MELECDGAISPATVMSFLNGSPHRRRNNDLEAGESRSNGVSAAEDHEESSGPFDITSTKNASVERLRRWRVRLRCSLFHIYIYIYIYINFIENFT
jgi:hypothetical protein